MRNIKKEIGLAVIGCGTIGRIRAILARDYPAVSWLGLCDLNEDLGKKLAEDAQADFFTTDHSELLKRPEVNAAIISTDENCHTEPTLAAIEQGHDLLIEKPLATDVKESLSVLKAIQDSGVDAVIGYTNRFRRRFLSSVQGTCHTPLTARRMVATDGDLRSRHPSGRVTHRSPQEGWLQL